MSIGRVNRYSLWMLAILTSLVCTGCFTTDKNSGPPGKANPTHYTLKLGTQNDHFYPLPQETKILVNWYYENGSVKEVEGFRGWDFDDDERFEMLEVLNKDGSIQAYVFDFDSDGVVDSVKKINAEAASVKTNPLQDEVKK